VIPERTDQQQHRVRRGAAGGRPVGYDTELYKGRNVVERSYEKFTQWRGLATRYDTLAVVFRGVPVDRDCALCRPGRRPQHSAPSAGKDSAAEGSRMTTYSTGDVSADDIRTGRRSSWALWGAAAGVLGLVTNTVLAQTVAEPTRTGEDVVAVVDALSRGTYHLATITGFASVACLLVFAAGMARWARVQTSDSLALTVVPLSLVASAGALIAAYGVKGQLASYLDGGFNEASYPPTGLYQYFLLDDLAGYFGWYGVTVACAGIAVLTIRERLLPRWIGVVCAVPVLVAVAFLAGFGFPGISGLVAPLALAIAAVGMSRLRD